MPLLPYYNRRGRRPRRPENGSDILLDYELSSLSVTGTKDKNKISYMINNLFKPTIDYIKGFGDGSLQSGCENFLMSCGLTKAEINKIIEIMVV